MLISFDTHPTAPVAYPAGFALPLHIQPNYHDSANSLGGELSPNFIKLL